MTRWVEYHDMTLKHVQTGWVVTLLLLGSLVTAAPQGPEEVVRAATDRIFSALESECRSRGQVSAERWYQVVEDVLLPYADVNRMSRLVMGKYWREADAGQRQVFNEEFQKLLVRTYATAIRSVKPDQISYLPARSAPEDTRAVVRTEVQVPGAALSPINYYLYLSGGRWLVYDVQVDGISLVANYRSALASEFRDLGIQGLLDKLKMKNREKSVEQQSSASGAGC